jgi:hypothetical protein
MSTSPSSGPTVVRRTVTTPCGAAVAFNSVPPPPMKTYVIIRRSGWKSSAELGQAAARSSQVGQQEMSDQVRWIRSYVTDEGEGRVGTVCIYQATDEDAIREHARRAGLPCDSVVAVADTVIINADPVPAAKA